MSDVPARTIRLGLAYDGTGFRGWAHQRDPQVRTVEGELTAILSDVLGEPINLSVAGRTDAGVHARGQVASFTTNSALEPARLQQAVNGRLGPEVVVASARYAPAGFDARFSASAREYLYRIRTGEVADPFDARFEWFRPGELSVARMRAAAKGFVGEHDFTTFCRHPGHGRSTVRRLQLLSVSRDADVISFRARADSFLHQMVRSIVGTLVAIGDGKREPTEVKELLRSLKRSVAPQIAPPQGLTLERVYYGRRSR